MFYALGCSVVKQLRPDVADARHVLQLKRRYSDMQVGKRTTYLAAFTVAAHTHTPFVRAFESRQELQLDTNQAR
jgi:hypothetical protein